MEIVGQDCDDYDEPDNAGFEAVQLRMRVAVTNRRSEAVVFDPDRLRLVAPDSVRPSPVAADSPFTLQPGETKIAGVRFMNRGSLKCAQEMKLDPSDSLTNGHRPVEVPPIAFVAHEKH